MAATRHIILVLAEAGRTGRQQHDAFPAQRGACGGGFVLLTGEIGAGKTTVCRCFLEQVPENCRVAYIFNPKLTVGDLLKTICQKRGAAVIKARGASSAASAANAALDTLRSLHFPTPAGDWHSAAVLSKGDYGITPGIMFGYPLRTKAEGSWEIVQGLPIDAFSKEKIAITEKELLEERATASEALGLKL